MNRRLLALCLAMTMILLTGCQLAKPEGAQAAQPDRLVGIYVTTEHLDLFDADRWAQDNIGSIVSGDDIAEDISGQYQQRLYATLVEEEFTGADGNTRTTQTYAFPEVEGMLLAAFLLGEGAESYHTSEAHEAVCDVHMKLNSLDTGSETAISGNIYVSKKAGDVIFYFNPVYQTAEGEVYLLPGSGMSANAATAGGFSQTLSDKVTVTENGETHTESSDISLRVDFMELPQKVVLIQMDAQSRPLQQTEYIPGQMPEEIVPESGAAYVVKEEYRESGIIRSLQQNGDDPIQVFYTEDGTVCIAQNTVVHWPDAA